MENHVYGYGPYTSALLEMELEGRVLEHMDDFDNED